jgi:hypothetical protein
VPVALSLLVASCGSDSSKETSTSVASAPSGSTSTTPESGASGVTGTQKSSGAKKKSRDNSKKASGTGGAAPAPSSPNKVKQQIKRKKSALEKKIQKLKDQTKGLGNNDGSSPPTNTTPPPAPKPSATPQVVLYNKSKRVCDEISLNGLAQKYSVEATPEAVSTAYAASYPETFRKAVHDGCLAAFS